MKKSFTNFVYRILGIERKEYSEAMSSLKRIQQKINKVTMEFPNVSSFDFKLVKNKWGKLPPEVCTKVEVMGLHVDEDYRSMLCFYSPGGEIKAHQHSKEWEIIQILEGSCYDKLTDTRLTKGDVYIIPRGMNHHIISEDEECYMYILFTEHKENLIIPHTEPDLAKKFISKKRLTQPEKIK